MRFCFLALLLLTNSALAGGLQTPMAMTDISGNRIDLGFDHGHCGPCLEDFDGDGDLDLIVGTYGVHDPKTNDINGRFHFFENVGTSPIPKYETRGPLQADGGDAVVPIYCCIGASPVFADLNGDGRRDLISGCYHPGGIYWFPRMSDSSTPFAVRQELLTVKGESLLRYPDQRDRVRSYGSWPAPIDWDNDGDLDLVIGTINGTITYRENIGSKTEPVFSDKIDDVTVNGNPVVIPHDGHAAVAIADWDNDGLWDLLSGCMDGSVSWFRNKGRPGAPAFEEGVILIPASQSLRMGPLVVSEDSQPGRRAQIHVADYNQDGWMDILVGDYHETYDITQRLTADEQAHISIVTAKLKDAEHRLKQDVESIKARVVEKYPGELLHSEMAHREQSRMFSEAITSDERQKLNQTMRDLYQELESYVEKKAQNGYPLTTAHGYVWLYLREAGVASSGTKMSQSELTSPKSDLNQPVRWTVDASRTSDHNQNGLHLKVTGNIQTGYHIQTTEPMSSLAVPTSITVDLPCELTLIDETLPKASSSFTKDGLQDVYEGELTFTRTYRHAGNFPPGDLKAKVTIRYQACNETHCLKPETEELVVNVHGDSR